VVLRVQDGAPVPQLPGAHLRVARPARFCVTIRRNFQEVAATVAEVDPAREAAVGLVMATSLGISRRAPARAVVAFNDLVFPMEQPVPAVERGRVPMEVESNDQLDPERVAAASSDLIGPAVERAQDKMAAGFSALIVPDGLVKTAAEFVPTDREGLTDLAKTAAGFVPIGPADRMMVAFPIADPIAPAEAAAASAGIAMIGETGPIIGLIVFPIATSGTTGETIDAPTSGTTGTTIGVITMTGSTTTGGIITMFTGRTTRRSTIGVGRRGRR
jgi:hypothetical protein